MVEVLAPLVMALVVVVAVCVVGLTAYMSGWADGFDEGFYSQSMTIIKGVTSDEEAQ